MAGCKGGGILFLIHVLFMPFALQRETPKKKKTQQFFSLAFLSRQLQERRNEWNARLDLWCSLPDSATTTIFSFQRKLKHHTKHLSNCAETYRNDLWWKFLPDPHMVGFMPWSIRFAYPKYNQMLVIYLFSIFLKTIYRIWLATFCGWDFHSLTVNGGFCKPQFG